MENVWLYAIVGGFVPTILWVLYWYQEDGEEAPEPYFLVIKTFFFGVIAALAALFIQSLIAKTNLSGHRLYAINSCIEEIIKLLAVFIAAFGTVWMDERKDPILYMLTGALGFSAMENVYYIIDHINNGHMLISMIDEAYRTIGATLLHSVASSIIGILIALVFFQKRSIRILATIIGLFIASSIHMFFNLLVISPNPFYNKVGFYAVWGAIIFVLVAFEYIGRMCQKSERCPEPVSPKDKFRKAFF